MMAIIELKEYGVKPVVVLSPTIRDTATQVLRDAKLLIHAGSGLWRLP
jgi:hypothetical protein